MPQQNCRGVVISRRSLTGMRSALISSPRSQIQDARSKFKLRRSKVRRNAGCCAIKAKPIMALVFSTFLFAWAISEPDLISTSFPVQ